MYWYRRWKNNRQVRKQQSAGGRKSPVFLKAYRHGKPDTFYPMGVRGLMLVGRFEGDTSQTILQPHEAADIEIYTISFFALGGQPARDDTGWLYGPGV